MLHGSSDTSGADYTMQRIKISNSNRRKTNLFAVHAQIQYTTDSAAVRRRAPPPTAAPPVIVLRPGRVAITECCVLVGEHCARHVGRVNSLLSVAHCEANKTNPWGCCTRKVVSCRGCYYNIIVGPENSIHTDRNRLKQQWSKREN